MEDTPKCVHCKVLFLTNTLRIVKYMSCYNKKPMIHPK